VPRAWAKESDVITPGYRELIAASPFCVVATRGADGIDCSPRGDAPGFVEVLDEHTLVIPDRRGNNRLDTLRNILQDNEIGLIFLIPGIGEAVRVRGTAVISTDPDLLARHHFRGIAPVTVLVVTVSRIYFQCRRASLRSTLWQAPHVDPAGLPTPGRLQAEVGAMAARDADAYDAGVAEYAASTLYDGPTKA
jgi:PPOX class probable FMN-dependent enzyme